MTIGELLKEKRLLAGKTQKECVWEKTNSWTIKKER